MSLQSALKAFSTGATLTKIPDRKLIENSSYASFREMGCMLMSFIYTVKLPRIFKRFASVKSIVYRADKCASGIFVLLM